MTTDKTPATLAVDVLTVMEDAALVLWAKGAWPVDPDAEALGRARTSVSGLIKSQEDDALLVSVLLSYLNDHLLERDKRRLAAELMTRGLPDHEDRRAAALARVKGESA